MNWKVMLTGLAFVCPIVYFMAVSFGNDPRALDGDVLLDKPASAFTLNSIEEGYKISFNDYKGSPMVINFWAIWCQPCLAEHPDLLELAERYKPKGVVFLGMLYYEAQEEDEKREELRKTKAFLKTMKYAYPTLDDWTQSTVLNYGVTGVPETFVIDKEGVIVKKFVGPIDKYELSSILDGLL